MKINVGAMYTAHAFDDYGDRVNGFGFFHFEILAERKSYGFKRVYLGLRQGATVNCYSSQCFWFDCEGVHKNDHVTFKLKRKIKKEPDTHMRYDI